MFDVIIDFNPIQWLGQPTLRSGRAYRRKPAGLFIYRGRGDKERQRNFELNLGRIAEALRSNEIPVDFRLINHEKCYLDRGCLKMAETSGFIEPLQDDSTGTVSWIRLRNR